MDIKNKVLLQQVSSLDIEGEIIEHEVKRIIWTEIARLAGDYKEIMAMSLEGYSTKEISEELNLSEQTIKNKKGEALNNFAKYGTVPVVSPAFLLRNSLLVIFYIIDL